MPWTDDPVEVALMLQRATTVLCGGYNASYFCRSWWRLSGAGNGRRARRVAAAVLALTNLAFLVTSAAPVLPAGAGPPGPGGTLAPGGCRGHDGPHPAEPGQAIGGVHAGGFAETACLGLWAGV